MEVECRNCKEPIKTFLLGNRLSVVKSEEQKIPFIFELTSIYIVLRDAWVATYHISVIKKTITTDFKRPFVFFPCTD